MSDSIFGNPAAESPQKDSQETPEKVEQQAQPSEQPEVKPAEAPDPYQEMLMGIKTHDGRQKFTDVAKALESIPHAQSHIDSLAEKVKELESRLKESRNVDEVLKQLESKQTKVEQPSPQGFSEEQLAAMLEKQLSAREQAQTRKANQQSVVKALADSFGDKAEDMYKTKASELGVDVGLLNDLAATSPRAVLAYFGVSAKASASLAKSSVNTAAMGQAPKPAKDPMAIFKSSESDLVKKWRDSVSKVEG